MRRTTPGRATECSWWSAEENGKYSAEFRSLSVIMVGRSRRTMAALDGLPFRQGAHTDVAATDDIAVITGPHTVRHIVNLVARFGAESPRMVVIAPDVQPGDIRVAFTHGVTSYVIEGEAIPFLGTCLAEVIVNSAKGMNCLAPTAATVLVNRIQATTRRTAGTILSRRTVPHPEGQPLTTREASIMHMLASGSSISEVATQLCLSKYTIRNNMSHIFAKLGVHRQPEAVLAWIRHRQHGGR